MKHKRVVLVGLDGVSPTLIESLLADFDLPALQKIHDEGAFGALESTIPYLTPPAWISMVTGVNPGKHGIYDFFKLTENERLECVWSTDCRSETIWDILTDSGLESIVLNVPMTYPPKPIEGVMVSGMPAPRIASFPEDLADGLDERGYQHDIVGVEGRIGRETVDQILSELADIESLRAEVCLDLLKDHIDWGFCMVVFYFPDRVLHFGVDGLDVLHALFVTIDDLLQALFSEMDENDLLLIASDHGLVPTPRSFLINQWLVDQGLLNLKKGVANRILGTIGLSRENLVSSSLLFGLFSLGKSLVPRVHEASLNLLARLPGQGDRFSLSDFDLKTSSIFSYGTALPVALLKVNESAGNGLTDALYSELRGKLLKVTDPQSGRRVIKDVLRGDQLFHGDYAVLGPDIVVEAYEGYTIDPWTALSGGEYLQDTKPLKQWDHSLAGTMMAYGGGVKKQKISAQISDIAPTVLYAMDCPIPEHFDGRVLTQLFGGEQDAVVEYVQTTRSDTTVDYESKEDMAEIMKRLRGLGYLD